MKVLFYISSSGRRYVEEFISRLQARLQAAVVLAIDEIVKNGLDAPGVTFRQIRGKLWEIKVQAGGAARIFYLIRSRKGEVEELILLHAYLKQSRKAPTKEIEVAESRMKEVLE